jgi:hypothetical protein
MQYVPGAVHDPRAQHGWSGPPHDPPPHDPLPQLPSMAWHATPAWTQRPSTQHPPPAHKLPGQQGRSGEPQTPPSGTSPAGPASLADSGRGSADDDARPAPAASAGGTTSVFGPPRHAAPEATATTKIPIARNVLIVR